MRIDPTDPRNKISAPDNVRRRSTSEASDTQSNSAVEDQIALAQIHNMVDQLISQPEIRKEMVDLGNKLVADPSYPPSEVVEKVAALLSRALRR